MFRWVGASLDPTYDCAIRFAGALSFRSPSIAPDGATLHGFSAPECVKLCRRKQSMSIKKLQYFVFLLVVADTTICSSEACGQLPASERLAPANTAAAKTPNSNGSRVNASSISPAKKGRSERKRNIEFVCEFANRLIQSDKLLDAENVASKCLEAARIEDGGQSDIGDLLRILARIKYLQSKLPESVAFMKSAIELKTLKYGDKSIMLIDDLDLLGSLELEHSQYENSEVILKRSLSIKERAVSKTNPIILKSTDELARLCFRCQRFTEAEAYLRRSVAIREQFWGEDHFETSKGLGKLAALFCAQGKFSDAKPLLVRLMNICETSRATDSPEYAAAVSDLAGLYYCEKDLAKAESFARQAVSLLQKLYGPDDSRVQFLKTALENIAQRKDDKSMKWLF
jgi:tetratricopeptide (TPR) repeat protein